MESSLSDNGGTKEMKDVNNDVDAPLAEGPRREPSPVAAHDVSELHNRPPKPVPFGSSYVSAGDKEGDGRTSSECSRQGLRRDVAQRRHTLTAQEHGFLERLAVHGEEIEVQVAREKLMDETLFFDQSFEKENGAFDGSRTSNDSNAGDSSEQLSYSEELNGSEASSKRLEHLHARRKSELYGKMWRAHESGLAVTNGASRKSVLRRERSFSSRRKSQLKRIDMVRNSSFLSSATQDLLLEGGPSNRPGENDIFRSSVSSIKSASSRSRSVSTGTLFSANIPKKPSKNRLRRLRSEDNTRKSVTFKDDTFLGQRRRGSLSGSVPRRMSQPILRGSSGSTVPALPPGEATSEAAERRISEVTVDSFSSVAHDNQNPRSVSSIPSLHHAHPIRSDSISSIPSIHHAHPIRSDSVSSVPPLHMGRPIRSDSTASSILTPDAEAAKKWLSDLGEEMEEVNESNEPAWTAPAPTKMDLEENGQLLRHPAQAPPPKPVLLRRASVNNYQGEGIEASDWQDNDSSVLIDTIENARNYRSMVSTGSIYTSSSFDETKSTNRSQIFRSIGTSLSDDELSTYFLGRVTSPTEEGSSINEVRHDDNDDSWDLGSEVDHYDAWNVFNDEYAIDYGMSALPFRILGTSADDDASRPHVLSPPLLESLQPFLPYGVSEDNFWMKFSLIRDGASLHTLLQNVRGSRHTILALETADGEVFGSFTSTTWRKNWNYFGTGESFLWRMRQSRKTPCHSIIDQAHLESELDVYPWTGENNCIQLCTHDKIAVGSGAPEDERKETKDHDYGFGLAIDADLYHGTSSPCATFGSPSLSQLHQPGERFEIMNVEVWTLTPCMTVDDAEKLELGKLFLETN